MMNNLTEYMLKRIIVNRSIHPIYNEALNYILSSKGKQFRPELFFSVIDSYASDKTTISMDIAFAIEAVHIYSLIHDDLPMVDNASKRRGCDTLHVKYDDVTALLIGDALNSYAYELISSSKFSDEVKVKLVQELSSNSGLNGMVLGQAIDCYFENQKIDLDSVIYIHKNKTAKLIACSLKMGAIVSSLDELFCKNIYDFGLLLGLLFQVQDDILDTVSNDEDLGKPAHNDGDKNSFINIIGLNDSVKYADDLVSKIESMMNKFDIIFKNKLKIILEKNIYRHRDYHGYKSFK